MKIIEKISNIYGLSFNETKNLINTAQNNYRIYKIPKKTTGTRTIYHPSKQVKAVQYILIDLILKKLQVHNAAVGYIKGVKAPIKRNAEQHAKFPYSIRIDFKNFFSSISFSDLKKVLENSSLELSLDDYKVLELVLFKNGLPIGAPSSPLISNIVMFELDELLAREALKVDSNSLYTRYADDIVFSTSKKNGCKDFLKKLKSVLINYNHPKLTINSSKTKFMSRKSKRMVTGLIITPQGKVSIGRENKEFIKMLLYQYNKKLLNPEQVSYLTGYLSFIIDVEPAFFNTLVIKYGAVVSNLLKKI